ncbi:conserved hypothetical protein [Talaromyces stipitatus ATCC 10500]|uniref:DUF7587 domain-containing protein n=1 Tax=Talaromyces stipitatus (strain ATCC 10500 / CBS 375.48 / QM 6759 / NRRL 1006) TaxID=441959 RepID=B8MGZ8_TALSN|nr:uncharacterized protein TSTA_014710 [Talaromyces stipitatus ATCC 10500]EED16379.1 conserved hypothetical protein [Talaromyces stipitatus ATCC 10500]
MATRPRLVALNMKHRRPQHSWTQEERLLLCCAKRFFDLRNKDITKIFNYLYNPKIRAEGFTNGLPTSTLTTQWADMQRRSHKDWHAVHTNVSFAQGPLVFQEIIEKIRHACRVLGIGLVARAIDLIVHPQQPIHRRDSTNSNERPRMAHNTILHPPVVDQDREPTPMPQTQASRAPQAPTDTTSNNQVSTQAISRIRSYTLGNRNEQAVRCGQVPNILWRFSNDESMGINHRSGYVANTFIGDLGNIPTPEERAQEFPTWVEIHARPRKIPSPFISTSTDPLVAVHRALTRDKNAFVSIIDATQIKSQNIFYMKDLMQQYNIYTPSYRGAKEYVVWGSICRPAIVTSVRADELLQIAEENADIKAALQLDIISSSPNCKSQLYNRLRLKTFDSDLAVGRTIGTFLRLIRLPNDYLDDVANSLNTSWSFTTSGDTSEFCRGVHQGFQATPAPPDEFLETASLIQDTVMQDHDESTSDSSNHQITHDIDIRDYVIVDHPQQENVGTSQAFQTEVREPMDRLSIHDDTEELTHNQPYGDVLSLPIATATAVRTISLFNPDSESLIMVPNTQRSTPVLESIESAEPLLAQKEEEEEEEEEEDEVKPPIVSRTLTPTPNISSEAVPNTSTQSHARAPSESSESTIGPQTPSSNRFSMERSRIDRVLNYDWQSFWDYLHNVPNQ